MGRCLSSPNGEIALSDFLEKITALITRPTASGHELLLFEHPYAGNQIPAGTVEDGETPAQAIRREAREETGLDMLPDPTYLGSADLHLPDNQAIIGTSTTVYARPDLTSFDWAHLRKGIMVTTSRRAIGFTQVTYEELDRFPDPQYTSMLIMGWVPDSVVIKTIRRHFFHFEFVGHTEARWTVFTDNHHFTLFWAALDVLPPIISPQVGWLDHLPLKYRFAEQKMS
jgi:8-oxo-dGTP pyrophosphatase MutT (NUDIX family)